MKKKRRTPPGQQDPSQPVGPELHRDHPGAADKGADDRSDPKAGEDERRGGAMLGRGDPSQTSRGTCPTTLPLLERERAIRQSANAQTLFLGGVDVDGNGGGDEGFKFTTGNEVIVFVCVCAEK